MLKKEIISLKSINKEKQQAISEISSKQLCMEEQINKINNEHDKQGKLIQNISKKQNVFKIEATTEKNQSSTTTNDNNNEDKYTYSIPTSNSFDVLNKETSNLPGTDETNKENVPKNQPESTSTTPQKDDNNANNTLTTVPRTIDNAKNLSTTTTQKDDNSANKPIETIIVCDSNGRYLKPELLCPNSPTQYIRCPTLTDAMNLINNSNFTHAKCFIIHCGTNDLEKVNSESDLIHLTEKVMKAIREKYPNARIIISGLLPRKDPLNRKVIPFNDNLGKIMAGKQNITFVNHKNIKPEDMKDKKHLSQDKVKYLAKNLKAAFFNTKPKSRIRKPKSEQFYKYQRESPRRRNPIFNLYNPEPHVPTSTLPYPFPPQLPPKPQFNPSTIPHQQQTPYLYPNNTKPSPPLPHQASNHMSELIKELYRCLN